MTILVSVLEQSCRKTARLKSVVHGRWKVGSEKERIMQPDEHPSAQDDLETDEYLYCVLCACCDGRWEARERERERELCSHDEHPSAQDDLETEEYLYCVLCAC